MMLVLTRFESPLSPHWQSQQLQRFSPQEHARFARLSRPLRRQQFVVGHAVLRHMLSEALGDDATIEIGSSGDPCIAAATRTHASIAHSGTAVAVALSSEPIGVDLESARTLRDPRAAAALMNLSPDTSESTAVLRAWVAREAWVKVGAPPVIQIGRASWDGCELALAGVRNAPLTRVFHLGVGIYNAVDLAWEMCVYRPVGTPRDIDVRNPVRATRGWA